ncbi:MAG: hypothetical protein KKA73_03010 [Chloroflexi bacterium]|nr:hypothetical protein [Chloroflexota bacterium]MBU1746634.1 hypothetical protein [Chloroflexota bacterium]
MTDIVRTLDPTGETERAARLVQQALTQLGHAYTTQDGRLVQICYKSLSVAGDRYGLLEVDTQRLPPKVNVARLVHEDVLHHLTAVVGKPVHRLNTTGLTYCVALQPAQRVRLPRHVALPQDLAEQLGTEPYRIPIGVGHEGPVWRSLLQTGHILVGGETGGGKSTWLQGLLAALLTAHDPTQLQLYLVDPKIVELALWADIPHLGQPIATEVDEATAVIERLLAELDRRAALFQSVLARNLAAYNARAAEPLPLVLLVIDEVTDLALQAGLKSPFYIGLTRLVSKARSFGIVLVVATQHPKAEVLNTLIRENFSTRLAFRVTTVDHSRVILGTGGAQEIPRTVRGRMLARVDNRLAPLQGYYVADETLQAVAQQVRGQPVAPPLADIELALVRYATAHLDGAFHIDKLTETFKGQPGASRRQLLKRARRWEARGWLTPALPGQQARQITAELLALVG